MLVRQRNELAFTALYYRYYELLCDKAYRRMPDESMVQEIVQDVFLTFWDKASELDAEGNIAGWLYATLRNKILHELRAEETRQKYLHQLQQLNIGIYLDNSVDLLQAKQTEERITAAIRSLPQQCMTALLLSRREGLSYREIALRMNISVKTVEKHISKALHVLRTELSEHSYLLLLGSIVVYAVK